MKKKFSSKVLENGMTVLHEMRDLPVVSVMFGVKSGGVNEELSEKGISHFIEHMLYKGTKTRDYQKIAEEIERRGGVLNGFTADNMTGFLCKMPSKHLSVALEVLGDIVSNPLFNSDEIEKERHVIFEEMKMHKDNPGRYSLEGAQSCLFSGTLGEDLIGDEKTVGAMTRDILKARFDSVYSPCNMVLSVVGDCEFDALVAFAEKNFEKGACVNKKVDFGLRNEVRIEEREGLGQANLVFAYHVPVSGDKGSYVARVLGALMTDGLSSRLSMEIREKHNLAYAVSGGAHICSTFGYNFVHVGCMKENVEKVKEIILKEFDKLASGLEELELSQVKEQMIGNYYIEMENSQEQMINLFSAEVNGKAEDFYDYDKRIEAVGIAEVKKMASGVGNNYSFFALVPK